MTSSGLVAFASKGLENIKSHLLVHLLLAVLFSRILYFCAGVMLGFKEGLALAKLDVILDLDSIGESFWFPWFSWAIFSA
jgi:hypothetical protein